MERRKFTREFKLEAVRLIKERGVSYSQFAVRQFAGAKCRFGSEAAALAWGSHVCCTPKSCRDNRRLLRQLRARTRLPRRNSFV
jgi:hypothetical protein